MKKILFSLLLVCSFAVSKAQQTPTLMTTTSHGLTLDTVNNTEAISTATLTVGTWFANKTVNAHIVALKISGTVGGTLGLYGSMDGTNWTICETATTPSDGSANYFISTTKRFYKYKVMWTGTGTMSASLKTYLLH